MGLAGGVGLFNVSFDNTAYMLMSAAGFVAAIGHVWLLGWGKGDQAEMVQDVVSSKAASVAKKDVPLLARPFFPWRYPLDSGMACFMMSNVLFILAGIFMGNYALSANGLFAVVASLIAWLWPDDKILAGLNSMQLSALFFTLSSVSVLVAGLWANDPLIMAAAGCFLASNIILYTVRKASQSRFTQARS